MSQLSNGVWYDKIHKLILEKIKIKDVDKLSAGEPTEGENVPAASAEAESVE
jgi:hypothetical protein